MKTYKQGEWVFMKTGVSEFTCIGTSEEVFKATPEQLSALVVEALATAKWNDITSSVGQVIH